MKPIAIIIKGLRCDKPGCGYDQDYPTSKDYAEWLNAPCPLCGSSLLTQKDLDAVRGMERFTKIVNVFLGPVDWLWRLVTGDRRKAVAYDMGMNGTGSINLKKIEEEK